MLAVVGGLFWPIGLAYTAVRRLVVAPIHTWLWRPVDQRRARLERLRADLDLWAEKARRASSDDERRMARDVVESLTEIIRSAR